MILSIIPVSSAQLTPAGVKDDILSLQSRQPTPGLYQIRATLPSVLAKEVAPDPVKILAPTYHQKQPATDRFLQDPVALARLKL